MTNHLKYIDVREYARVVDIARELIERAEKAEAQVQRVLELAEFWKAQVSDSPSGASWVYMSAASRLLLDALDGDSDG